jgi:glycosyltransferase involved in cell wall biosynthesis
MQIALVRFFHDRNKIGHFEELYNITQEASRLIFEKTSIWNLSGSTVIEKVSDLKGRIQFEKPNYVHFEWLHDFESEAVEIAEILEAAGIAWSVTGSISHVERSQSADPVLASIFKDLRRFTRLRGIFTWDSILVKTASPEFPKLITIVDWQETKINEHYQKCCKWVDKQSQPIIGIVGQLYRYRGLELLLKFWRNRPSQPVYFAGAYFPRTYTLIERLSIFIGQKLRKIFIFPGWQDSAEDLNHHLMHLDALVLDTKHYPQPSGIATRARHFGIPVLIPDANSYLNDKALEDPGILVWDFENSKAKDLRNAIKGLQRVESVPSASRSESIMSFCNGWVAKT